MTNQQGGGGQFVGGENQQFNSTEGGGGANAHLRKQESAKVSLPLEMSNLNTKSMHVSRIN